MNISALFSLLGPRSVYGGDPATRQKTDQVGGAAKPNDSFGPASEVKLSDQARALLLKASEAPADKAETLKPMTPAEEFLKFAEMTPAEKYRAQILSGMGLTEEDLQAMQGEERKKIEDKIKKMIEEKIAQETGVPQNMSAAVSGITGSI